MENYNNNSTYQLNLMFRNIDIIHSSINNAIDDFMKTNKNESLKILDIGSSHGRNSIVLLDSIFEKIIKPKLPDTVIEVYHCDLEMNNWTELFLELNNNPQSYINKYKNTYAFGIGNTYSNQLLPNDSCTIIFSFNTLHWFKSGDANFKNKNSFLSLKESTRPPGVSEFNKQRLETAFKQRYNELSIGGVFICNFIILEYDNPQSYSIENSFTHVKSILRQMANESILSHQEVDEMSIPASFYKSDEIEYAIKSVEQCGLELVYFEKYYSNWNKSVSNNDNDNEPNDVFYNSIMAFSSKFIKKSIKGDESNVELIYNEFNKRLYNDYNKNPQQYNFSLGFNLVIFKKAK